MTASTVRGAIEALLGSVGSIMRRQTVVLDPRLSIDDAAKEMERAAVSGCPVMSEGRVVGMVSLSDLFRAAGVSPESAATSGPWHRYERTLAETRKTVADVMTRHVISISPEAPIAEAAELMRRHRVNRIPVVGEGGSLLGIVARDDVIEAVADVAHVLRESGAHAGGPALLAD